MSPKLLLLSALLSSCATQPRGWDAARRLPRGDSLSGAWSGQWISNTNGHRGALQCVMDRKSGDHCEFRYRASWSRVFSAAFTLEAKVQPFGRDRWLIRSEKDLGPVFGGTFRSNGTVAGDTFTARYESRMDNGEMIMRRVR